MRFVYCPQCGLKLTEKPIGDDGLIPYCTRCDRAWFDMFSSCVLVLVANEQDEVALTHQPHLSARYGVFTSGYIKPGETAEQAAAREVREELGLTIDSLESVGSFWYPKRGQLMHRFIGRCHKQPITCSTEVVDARWVPAAEMPGYMFPETEGPGAFGIYRAYMKTLGYNV